MKNAIFISTLTSQLIFFSILSIFGIEYAGIEKSLSYVIFCISFAALSLLVFSSDYFILRNFTLSLNAVLFFILPVFVSLIFFAEHTLSEEATRMFRYYLVFSLPASYIGIYVAERRWLASMAKWFEVFMIISTVSVITSLILPFINNKAFISFAGDTYQKASYVSAFAFSLNLFFILFGYRFKLFKFHYLKPYKIMIYPLLMVQIAGVLFSGGRGGFVVVVLATIILLWMKKKDEKSSLSKIIIVIIFFVLGALILLPKMIQNELFLSSTGRIFSYITSGGIDMSQTSGRDFVYRDAIRLIREKPLTGYGLFGYYDYMSFYPHNFFLEILLNGGILYLGFTIFIGLLFLIKLKEFIKKEPANLLVLTLFINPITELMFSGTYIVNSLFWFVVAYVFCYSIQNYKVSNTNLAK